MYNNIEHIKYFYEHFDYFITENGGLRLSYNNYKALPYTIVLGHHEIGSIKTIVNMKAGYKLYKLGIVKELRT